MKTWHEVFSGDRGVGLTMLLVTFCLTMVAGCDQSGDRPALIPVSGVVTMDGKPLAGARVSFVPEGARPSSGVTDATGRYELQYTGEAAGAVAGKHRVSISKTEPDPNYTPDPDNEDDVPTEVEIIPERYRGANSELTAEVTQENNTFDFPLTSE